MRRSLAFFFLLSACSPQEGPSVVSSDAGAVDSGSVTPDAGRVLPENPSLADLEGAWGDVVCSTYACTRHTRITEDICARAAAAEGWPYSTLRDARAAIEAGRATYNQDKGAACGALLLRIDTSLPCYGASTYTFSERYGAEFRQSCGELLTGTVAVGSVCDETAECADSGDCIFNRSNDCTGQCMVWLNAGDSCAQRPGDCGPERFCDGTICKWPNLLDNGAQCFSHDACESGKCFEYTCKEINGEMGECIQEGDCQEGLFCRPLPASTGLQGICQRPSPSGEECGYTVKCSGNQACKGYYTRVGGGWTEGVCTAAPVDVGAACSPIADTYDDGDTGCFRDLSCNPTTSTCEEAPATGAACAMPGNRCGLDSYCDDQSICRLKKKHGEVATAGKECFHYFNQFAMACEDPSVRDQCFGP